jgi:C4-type Zn-finger protein
MQIKCQQCGHENQLGAIFCRSCGAKLEINDLRPDVKDRSSGQGCFKIGCKIFLVMFLLLIISGVLVLFFPLNYTEYEPLSDEEKEKVTQTVQEMKDAIEGKSKKRMFIMTPSEASCALNDYLQNNGQEANKGGEAIIEVDEGDTIFIYQKKFLGVLRFRIAIKCQPEITQENGETVFTPNWKSFQFGNITFPIPEEEIDDNLEGDPKEFINKIEKFEVDEDGNFLIVFKKYNKADDKSLR